MHVCMLAECLKILLCKLPQKVLETILNAIINIHYIPLILNIIWKTLKSHLH